MEIRKNIKWILIFLVAVILLGLSFLAFKKYAPSPKPDLSSKKELTLGFISDIHAGSRNASKKEIIEVYPKKFRENLKPILNSNVDLIITLGDNIDEPSECQYAQQLKDIFKNKNALWSKGNHDKECFPILSDQNYYYFDHADWRIILLDHRVDADDVELEWLKGVLKTDKKVLVTSHAPILDLDNDGVVFPEYAPLEKVLSESGNVKYVFSGHAHNHIWDKEYNGVHYYIIPSLSSKNFQGYFMKFELK